jgi:hypothetical protein
VTCDEKEIDRSKAYVKKLREMRNENNTSTTLTLGVTWYGWVLRTRDL